MFEALLNALTIFGSALTLAIFLESQMHERHKAFVRAFLERIRSQPVVPARAIDTIDKIFGRRILSVRSILTSIAASVVGAIITSILIKVTSGSDINVGLEVATFAGKYPGQIALFCAIFLTFDYLSYTATRVFVRITAEVASLSRGLLMFVSDLLVSATVCIIGLATASTVVLFMLPTDFWPKTPEARPEMEDALWHMTRAVNGASDLRVSLTYDWQSPILLPNDMPEARRRAIESEGLISVLRYAPGHNEYSIPVQVMLGRISEADALSRLRELYPRTLSVESLDCDGGFEATETAQREAHIRAIYGSGQIPPCALPTPVTRTNPAMFNRIPLTMADDIVLTMSGLYGGKLLAVVSTKFNEYVSLNLPIDWANVVAPAMYYDNEPWVVSRIASAARARARYYTYADENAGDNGSSLPTSSQPSDDSRYIDDWVVVAPSADDSHTDDWVEEYVITDNLAPLPYPTFWDGSEALNGVSRVNLPISPLLGSALWLSFVFWAFVVHSVGAAAASALLSLAKAILSGLNWTRKPIEHVGGIIAGVLALLVFFLQLAR